MLDEKTIHTIFHIFQKNNPEPQTELHYHDAYTLLVAVVLSAQATDVSVNKATKELFEKAPTPFHMMHLPLGNVEIMLKTLNYYKTKAKNIQALSQILVEKYEGRVPHDREALESLPGVGRKTANVVLNVAFQEPTLAVDTHIHRVANRLNLCATKTPLATEQVLLRIIPKEFLQHAHHWLILHGRYVCKARNPLCAACPLSDLCDFAKISKNC